MKQLALSRAQFARFASLAISFTAEDRAAVARRASAIAAWRSEFFPGGTLRSDLNAPPPPPTALTDMRSERQALIKKYRALLHQSFGDIVALQIEATIRKRITPEVRVVDPGVAPRARRGTQ